MKEKHRYILGKEKRMGIEPMLIIDHYLYLNKKLPRKEKIEVN